MKLLGAIVLEVMRRQIRSKHGLIRKSYYDGHTTIKYLEANEHAPGPILVFLHGLGAGKDQWGPDIYRLTRHYHCLFIDLPGEGESSFDANQNYAPPAQALRINAFLDAKKLNDVVMIGSSNGGCVAILLAAQFPEKVSKLIAISPAGFGSSSLSKTMQRFLETGEHPFGYRTVKEMKKFWQIVFNEPPHVPGFIARARAEKGKQRYAKVNKIVGDFKNAGVFLLDEQVSKVRADTLVIWGTNDQVFDVTCTQQVSKELPRAKVQLIEGVGHLPYLESGAEVFNALEAFCNNGCAQEY